MHLNNRATKQTTAHDLFAIGDWHHMTLTTCYYIVGALLVHFHSQLQFENLNQ